MTTNRFQALMSVAIFFAGFLTGASTTAFFFWAITEPIL